MGLDFYAGVDSVLRFPETKEVFARVKGAKPEECFSISEEDLRNFEGSSYLKSYGVMARDYGNKELTLRVRNMLRGGLANLAVPFHKIYIENSGKIVLFDDVKDRVEFVPCEH